MSTRFSARFRERKNVFPCTQKRVCGITEFAWSLLGIFIVFTSSRSCACVLHRYGQHARGKVAHRAAFLRAGKVPASGNAFMETVAEKCSRTTYLLAETRTWKASLIIFVADECIFLFYNCCAEFKSLESLNLLVLGRSFSRITVFSFVQADVDLFHIQLQAVCFK